jgi:hypothetical protein
VLNLCLYTLLIQINLNEYQLLAKKNVSNLKESNIMNGGITIRKKVVNK